MAKTEYSSPLQFPTKFAIKAMGKANSRLEDVVLKIVQAEFPDVTTTNLKKRLSKDDNYLAVTVMVNADSKDQLDAIYSALSNSPEVIIAF